MLFTRNLGNIVMDLNDVETINLNALGDTDTVTVNDLSGTDVTAVNVNLAGTIGGSAGDGAADTVIVNGTSAGNAITDRRQRHVGVRPRPSDAAQHHQFGRRERHAGGQQGWVATIRLRQRRCLLA